MKDFIDGIHAAYRVFGYPECDILSLGMDTIGCFLRSDEPRPEWTFEEGFLMTFEADIKGNLAL